jgi:hypothetical protein
MTSYALSSTLHIQPHRASAATEGLRIEIPDAHSSATALPKFSVFREAAGGARQRLYIPMSRETVNEPFGRPAAGEIEVDMLPVPEEDLRAVEMEWLQEHQVELAAQYPGEWIAIEGSRLVAHAEDLSEVLRLAEEAGHPHPFVTAIPDQPITRLYL